MGADNWGKCPACVKKRETQTSKMRQQLANQYGSVSESVYLQQKDKIENQKGLSKTLREDFECYVDEDGSFKVNYSCSCQRCGFKFIFEHSENLT